TPRACARTGCPATPTRRCTTAPSRWARPRTRLSSRAPRRRGDTSPRRGRAAARHPEAVTATTDILIVGAGPTGLALAAQLNAFGVKARIIDRQLDPVHESRALVMQPRTLEALRGLGLAETL